MVKVLRPSPLLDAATRSRPAVNPAPPGTATAVLVGEGSTPSSVRVRLYGTELDLPAAPGKWVVNGLVWVEMAEGGRPVRVTGPAMEPREGQQVIDHMPGLLPTGPAELSDEDRRRFADAEQAIRDARAALATLDADLAELDGQLAATSRTLPVFGRYQPEGPHPEGTIWYQLNTSGQVTGVWEQTTAPEGTDWRGRPLTSTAVVSLTAAQITAGTGAFQTAVAQKIWAEVITAARVSANRGVFRDLVAEHVSVVSSSGGRGVRITDAGLMLLDEDGSVAVDLTAAGANDRQWRMPDPRPGPLARFPLSEGAAARIRDARLRQGVDQREFVRRHRAAGVHWSSAVQSNIERAQRRSTRGDMDALTAALGVEFTLAGGEWQ